MPAVSFAAIKNKFYLMKNYFFAAVAASALLFSCKKNDKETTCEKTVAAIAGNYKVTNMTVAGVSVMDQYMDACQKDDVFQLKADKTMIYDDAGTQCSPSGDDTGDWDIVNGAFTITLSSGDQYSGTIINKCKSFELTEDLGGGYKIVTTFTKQ